MRCLDTISDSLAGEHAIAWSGGSEPGTEVNPAAIAAIAERGIDISGEFPKPWTDEIVQAADVVITMGCGDACPIFPGKDYGDWDVDDPAGKDITMSGTSAMTSRPASEPCSPNSSPPTDHHKRHATAGNTDPDRSPSRQSDTTLSE